MVERDTSSAFSSPTSALVGENTTAYSSTGRTPRNHLLLPREGARNASASSGYSNVASATTAAQPPPPPGYANAVLADSPVSYWRLGEASGTASLDEKTVNPGTYVNAPTLGATSLLGSDQANKAVSLDGVNDHVAVPSSASLQISTPITLEAWIKPAALPVAGSFASVLTKPESYSLQFNGPQLEFTIMQFGTRQRLQAPAAAIVAGQTYHVVRTFDGTTRRRDVNGTSVASGALTGGATSTSNGLFVGSWDGWSEFLRGTVDDVAVYKPALTGARVSAHYSAGR